MNTHDQLSIIHKWESTPSTYLDLDVPEDSSIFIKHRSRPMTNVPTQVIHSPVTRYVYNHMKRCAYNVKSLTLFWVPVINITFIHRHIGVLGVLFLSIPV